MSIFSKTVGKLFGNKYEKDMKSVEPFVERIKEEYKKVVSLTNDELRGRTLSLKENILAGIKNEEAEIVSLREKAEKEEDVLKMQSIYDTIDKKDEEILEKLQTILDKYLPEAFAVMKETARRFKENETIEVTATDFDRDLAAVY